MIDVERKKGKEARPGGAGQIQIIFAGVSGEQAREGVAGQGMAVPWSGGCGAGATAGVSMLTNDCATAAFEVGTAVGVTDFSVV